jgi:uncharacterized membrane protein
MSSLPSTSAFLLGGLENHLAAVEAIIARTLSDADTRAAALIGTSLSQVDAQLGNVMSCVYLLVFLVALVVFAMTARPRPTIRRLDGMCFFVAFLVLNAFLAFLTTPVVPVVGVLFAVFVEFRGRAEMADRTERRENNEGKGRVD